MQGFDPTKPAYQSALASLDVRTNFIALDSCHAGPTAPSNPVEGKQWFDTANLRVMRYLGGTFRLEAQFDALGNLIGVGALPWLPFYEGTNPPAQIDIDPLDIDDAAAFAPSVVQDVVFRIPASYGYYTGFALSLRYFLNGAVSANVKLQLDYRPVTPGNPPEGGTSYALTYQINPMPSEATVAIVTAFTIPKANIPSQTAWVNCRLSRLGTDAGDGYPGEFCLMSITPKAA